MFAIEDENMKIHQQFRSLVTLHIRITLLSDVFSTAGQSQGRAATGLWQTLMNSIPRPILGDLGALHRASTWENLALNVGLSSKGIEVLASSSHPAESPRTDGVGAIGGSSSSDAGNASGGANASHTTDQSSKRQGSRDWNASALKHITQGIPNALAPFFQGMLSLYNII
jgi:E3 ubiquitin-protein ligase HUWE1